MILPDFRFPDFQKTIPSCYGQSLNVDHQENFVGDFSQKSKFQQFLMHFLVNGTAFSVNFRQ